MSPTKLRFKRQYAGYYFAKGKSSILFDGGRSEDINVHVDVRHMPEWNAPNRWAVTIDGEHFSEIGRLFSIMQLTDIVAPTKAEAVRQAQDAVAGGFKSCRFGGYATR